MPDSVELPCDELGYYYHLNCKCGDVAPYIVTCGDPARAAALARLLDQVQIVRRNREFITYTGTYRGIPVSVMATGIGPDNTAIAMVEAAQCAQQATFIRLGSSGALQEYIQVGDLVITEQALRDERTTHFYASPQLQALAHPQVVKALKQAAVELHAPYHLGLTCTTADFFAGQGRQVPGFPCREPDKVARLQKSGVLNFDMEMSVYLTLARVSTYQLRAGGVCVVFANRLTGESLFTHRQLRKQAEARLLQVGLRSLTLLAAADGLKPRME